MPRLALPVIALAAVAGAVVGLGASRLVGGGGGSRNAGGAALEGQAVWRAGSRPAPPFSLRDQAGRRVSLASLRGRTVLLAFLDSRCRRQCPLVGRAVSTGLRMVPRAERPALVIVSVDPWGDTPASARAAIARFGLAPFRCRWLLGSLGQLAPVWHRYGIGVRRGATDVEHVAGLYMIDSRGFERAGLAYPLLPVWVAHDVQALAATS